MVCKAERFRPAMAIPSTIKFELTDDDISTAHSGRSALGDYSRFFWQMEVLLGGREGTVILQPRSTTGAVLGSGIVDVAYDPLD